ncbi:MAG: hypothetical protein KBT35_01205 [Firmicutes bacterium]|nr:hypothetical protein [Candidatus Colivicinus equi]
MDITKILIMSVFVEAIITYAKEMLINKKIVWQQLVSIIFGIFVAIAYNMDLPRQFELISTIPFVGNVITGIIISRGSNYTADLIKMIQQYVNNENKEEIKANNDCLFDNIEAHL